MFKTKWIPLHILQKALIEKYHREIELYIYLKITTDGRLKLKGRKKSEVLQVLSISESTLYRRLRVLQDWNWVGFDDLTQTYFIRGYNYVLKSEQAISRTAVKFTFKDILQLQTFSFSACVGFLLRSQTRRKRRGAERKTWRSKQSPASTFKPVALSVMKSVFSLSKDTVIKLKKLSIIAGYLKRKRGIKELHHASKHSREYYRSHPEHWGLLRKHGNMIVIIQPDEFNDCHIYKRYRLR